jgi:hypothetical protein
MTYSKEPTFCLKIQECFFKKQTQENLYKKLKLMREMGLTKYYTIIDDTETIYADDTKSNPKTETPK